MAEKNEEIPANYPFPTDFAGNEELEPVKHFDRSPAGQLIARMTAESRDDGARLLFSQASCRPGSLTLWMRAPALT